MFLKYDDEKNSMNWSKKHRHAYLHKSIANSPAYRKAIGYYLANPTTNRCIAFLELSGQMYDGKVPIDTKRLGALLDDIEFERKWRGR